MPKTERMSGELLYTIDPKGRMSFPPKFREILGERFILTKGPNNKLVAYSEENWERLVEQIAEMDLGREKDILTQMCVKAASPVEADKLGRILVPQALRQFAGLVKDVYVVGAIDEVEIWDRANYDAFNQSITPSDFYAAMAGLKLK